MVSSARIPLALIQFLNKTISFSRKLNFSLIALTSNKSNISSALNLLSFIESREIKLERIGSTSLIFLSEIVNGI